MTESAIQSAICDYLDTAVPVWFRHRTSVVMGNRPIACGLVNERAGLRGGGPDLLVPTGGNIWLEVKAPKGRVRDNQRDWAEYAGRSGERVFVVRSVADARAVIEAFFGAPQKRTKALPKALDMVML